MNYRLILKAQGRILNIGAALMLPSLAVSLLYGGDDARAFIISIVIMLVVSVPLSLIPAPDKSFFAREGFSLVAITWVLLSLFGALPYYFSERFPSFIDCIFESASGFSTTGATVLRNVELLPEGLLFWRSFTLWIGGMGVLVLSLAVMPSMGAGSVHLLKAESPGPTPGKIVPKIAQGAKILYLIYAVLTAAQIVSLLIAGLPLYDSLITAFGTAGTGGFTSKALSIGAYNNLPVEIITTVFMFLFGVSFSLFYQFLKGNFKSILKNEELRFYTGIVSVAIILITVNIFSSAGSLGTALRQASFQAVSVITTTGYATTDFSLWPTFSQSLLLILVVVGACAGSTGGGLKGIRVLLIFKSLRREVKRIIHPRSVETVKLQGRPVDDQTIHGALVFLGAYIILTVFAALLISVDNFDFTTSFTAALACVGNIGAGLGAVGPMGNYESFSLFSKLVLSFCMIIGRLEFMPVLMLLFPSTWKRT